MDLKAFRVRMYKGILDSGWVDIDSLTVLVGKNESGKTSLLKALHKLNPYESDPYEMVKEWPRGLRTERSEEHVVCVARFQLSDQEKSELTEITHIEKIPDIVEASRNYSGKLEIKFEEELSLDESIPVEIDTTEIDAILDKLPKVRDNFSDEFKKYADECLNEARRLASENQFIELEQLVQTHKPLLKEKRVQSHADSYRVELRFTKQYLAGLDQLVQNLPPLLSVQSKVDDYLIEHLPTFIYMDDYRAFSGTAHLDD
jgi:predicted ATP-dependent endonuclease of OLD family